RALADRRPVGLLGVDGDRRRTGLGLDEEIDVNLAQQQLPIAQLGARVAAQRDDLPGPEIVGTRREAEDVLIGGVTLHPDAREVLAVVLLHAHGAAIVRGRGAPTLLASTTPTPRRRGPER